MKSHQIQITLNLSSVHDQLDIEPDKLLKYLKDKVAPQLIMDTGADYCQLTSLAPRHLVSLTINRQDVEDQYREDDLPF